MEIIKNGREKTFFHLCEKCRSEFSYNLTETEECITIPSIKCPVCGNIDFCEFAELPVERVATAIKYREVEGLPSDR